MTRCWLVVGSKENWRTAFENGNIWGLRISQMHLWDTLQEGDKLLFYVTKPVGGLIGFGIVRTKFRQNNPLWPQEIRESRVIWPLRFEFDVEYCLPPHSWVEDRIPSKRLFPRGGFQPLDKQLGKELMASLLQGEVVDKPKFGKTCEVPERVEPERVAQTHADLISALVQIGRLQKYLAESEYPFDVGRLDVVWRRVELSVPTYVFEVQIGGNLHQALSKLKHAHDIWNSHVYLVTPKSDFEKANTLLSGTFHEIQDILRLIDCPQVMELLERKRGYLLLEKELGIT